MEPLSVVIGALTSMALGGLVGLEREFGKEVERRKLLIGIRTSILISLLGYMSVVFREFIDINFSLSLGFIFTIIALSLSYISRMKLYKATGITTFVAGILIFLTGVFVGFGENLLGLVLAVLITTVLAVRREMHLFVRSLEREELLSAIKFSIIAFVIFPLLPNYPVDPMNLFNPYQFWTIVVIISIIQFFSFVMMRLFEEKGRVFVGFFGGFVNSEATTYTLAEEMPKKIKCILSPILLSIISMIISSVVISFFIYPSLVFLQKLLFYLFPSLVFLSVVSFLKMDFSPSKSKIKSPYSLVSALKFAGLFFVLTLIGDIINFYSSNLLVPAAFFMGLISATPVVASISLLISVGNIDMALGSIAISFAVIGAIVNKNLWIKSANNPKLSKKIFVYTTVSSLLTLAMILLLI